MPLIFLKRGPGTIEIKALCGCGEESIATFYLSGLCPDRYKYATGI